MEHTQARSVRKDTCRRSCLLARSSLVKSQQSVSLMPCVEALAITRHLEYNMSGVLQAFAR